MVDWHMIFIDYLKFEVVLDIRASKLLLVYSLNKGVSNFSWRNADCEQLYVSCIFGGEIWI